MANRLNTLYEFEEFRFDAATGILWRDNELVSLPPKATGVLKMLLEGDGSLVSKQSILETVWADTFVEEAVLTQSIYQLRQTLGSGRPFILTVARRGYRFGVPVKKTDSDEATATVSSNEFPKIEKPIRTDVKTAVPPRDKISSKLRAGHLLLFAVVVILVGVLGLAAFRWFGTSPEASRQTFAPIEQLRFQRLTDSGDVVYPTISPNGEMLAYVRLQDEQGSLWVKQIATDSAVEILPASAKGYRSLAFSPDGKYLFFRQEADGSSVYQCSVLGGTPKKVADNVWSDFGISPDGTQLSFVRRDADRKRFSLVLSGLDGGGEREVASRENPADFRSTPAFSPDGRRLIVSSGLQGQTMPKLLLIDLTDGSERELPVPRWRALQRALWMPNGQQLIISARDANEPYSQLWLYFVETGEVRRLTNDLEAYFWISISADGKKIVTRQQRLFSHLWHLPEGDIKRARQITAGGRNLDGYAGVAWTPDKRLIYSVFANNVTDLFLINPDGSGRLQLTENAGQDNHYPELSPDGKLVVFLSNRDGTGKIYTMDADGRNQKVVVGTTKPNDRLQSPVFSRDGNDIYFLKRTDGVSGIWSVPVSGGEPRLHWQPDVGATDGFISFSPDGSRIAYHHLIEKSGTAIETPTLRICVRRLDGSDQPRCFDLPARRPFVQWYDDENFDFAAGAFNTSTMFRQPVDGGPAQKLFDVPDRIFGFAWSTDRKELILARGKQSGDALLITNLP